MPIIELYPEPVPTLSPRYALKFSLDILPADLTANRFTNWLPRLKADGVEILLRDSCNIEESDRNIGWTLNATLLKTTDRSALTPDASIDFGFGKKIAGVWDESTFVTLMTGAKVQAVQVSIEGSPQNPKDRLSVTIVSAEGEKLNRTSASGLVIYDPDRVTIDQNEFQTIYDKDGQSYSPEMLAVPGLDLDYLFNYVFVTKCGFTGYQTDIPVEDYPVDQFRVGMGKRFFDSLAPYFAMYDPHAVRVENDVVGVWDMTKEQPTGFPAPKSVTLDLVANQLNLSQEKQKLDALMLHFVGVENNYDRIVVVHDDSEETPGKNTHVSIRKSVMQFIKDLRNGTTQLIKELLWIEDKTTTINATESEVSTESYDFDPSFEVINRQKFTRALLPDLDGGLTAIVMPAENEREKFLYLQHPYKPRTKYLARREMQRDGLITVDSDNPNVYGDPAKQAAKIADRSNNTADGQTYEWGSLVAHVESAEPLKDSTVRVRIFETDEAQNQVTIDKTETRAGEIGVNAFATTDQMMPVFAEDNATRSLERIDDIFIGPLPLKYGIPLATRVLVNRQNKNQNVTLPVIGYDASLRKGFAIAPKDRDGVSLGNFLITGVGINFSNQGLFMNLTAREISDTTKPLQDVPATSNSIAAGAVQTYTIPIDCTDGFVLTLSPRPVDDLVIEAKRSADSVWIDLESLDIDLSTWDGTTQDFDIRITAGSVTDLTHANFEVAVDQA